MKLTKLSKSNFREGATLAINKTGRKEPVKLFLVYMNNTYAVDHRGYVFKIGESDGQLGYTGISGQIYSYDGMFAGFAADSKSKEVYSHCKELAERLFEFWEIGQTK